MPRGGPPSLKRPATSSKTDAAAAMGRRPSSVPSGAAPPPQVPAAHPGARFNLPTAPPLSDLIPSSSVPHPSVNPGVSDSVDSRNTPKPRRSSLNTALGLISGGHQGTSQDSGTIPIADADESWFFPDYSSMPSQDNYFTNLLNQEGAQVLGSEDVLESDNELSEAPFVAEMSSQPKTKGRTKNFTEEEDMLLISAYINVSKDPIAGRDQKDGRFWERIEKYYSDNRKFDLDRNCSSLRHRWGTISKEVSLFNSYYEAIERKNESGKTINDKIAEAKSDYQRLRKKAFSLFHAWNVLRHEPKWASIQDDKPDVDGNDQGGQNVARPPGRKSEKERMRGKKREDEESDPFIEEVKKMRESRLETERDRRVREDQFLELEKTKIELERDQHDKEIMETDTSTMDNESKKYFKLMKEEILARRFGSRQQ